MKFSDYLDSIENTEQEQQLKEQILIIRDDVKPAMNMPIIGKLLCSLVALGESETIEEFKYSGHYDNIKDWDIHVFDLEKGYFSIYPGAKHRKVIAKFLLGVCAGLFIFWLYRKCRRNCLR